jgi:hypothetical protein
MFITLNAIPVEIHGMGFTENINGIVDQYCRVFTLMANAIKHLSVDDISYSQGKYPTNYSYSLESIQVLHMQTIHDSCSVKDFTITSDSNGALIKASTGYPGLYATLQFQYKLILNGLTVSFGTLTGYIGSRKSDFQCLFKTGISDTHCSLKAHFNMDMFTLKGVDVTNDVKEKIKVSAETHILPKIEEVVALYGDAYAADMILFDKYNTIEMKSSYALNPMAIQNKNPSISFDESGKTLLVSYNSMFLYNQQSLELPSSLLLRVPSNDYGVLLSSHVIDDIINQVVKVDKMVNYYSFTDLSKMIGSEAIYSYLGRLNYHDAMPIPSLSKLEMTCTPAAVFAKNYIINSLFSFTYMCTVNPEFSKSTSILSFELNLIREIKGSYEDGTLYLSLGPVSEFGVLSNLKGYSQFMVKQLVKQVLSKIGVSEIVRISIPKPSDDSKFQIYSYLLDILGVYFES